MIKNIQEFKNTYVKNTPELREAFLSVADKFGIGYRETCGVNESKDCVVAFWQGVDGASFKIGCWYAYADQIKDECRELTLSDIKPRTRTEYEKVDFKPDEIWKAFKEHQEDGFLFVQTSDEFECLGDGVFTLAMAISQGDQLYRKVEKGIDERQEFVDLAIDKIEPFNCDDPAYYDNWFGQLYDAGCRFQD